MKVAHIVNPYLFLNGTWIYNQIRFQKKYNPIVLTTRKENLDLFPLPGKIFSLDDRTYLDQIAEKIYRRIGPGYLPHWFTVCQNQAIGLIHSHFGVDGYINLNLAKKLGIKHIVSFYGVDMGLNKYDQFPWKQQYARLFREADGFVAEGPEAKNTLIKMGCPPGKIFINHLGVDVNNIPFKKRNYSKNKKIKILVAGTFTEKKGIEFALKAFTGISRVYSNAYLTIIGDARQRKEELEIKTRLLGIVRANQLGGKVSFTGNVKYNELISLALDHDIFLSPSVWAANGDSEGGAPVTLMDMSATGLPVVSTFHCDIPEVIIHEKSGLLSPEKDVDSLVKHLAFLIDHPETGSTMGRYGRAHIEKEFNARVQVNKLELIYDRVISQS